MLGMKKKMKRSTVALGDFWFTHFYGYLACLLACFALRRETLLESLPFILTEATRMNLTEFCTALLARLQYHTVRTVQSTVHTVLYMLYCTYCTVCRFW